MIGVKPAKGYSKIDLSNWDFKDKRGEKISKVLERAVDDIEKIVDRGCRETVAAAVKQMLDNDAILVTVGATPGAIRIYLPFGAYEMEYAIEFSLIALVDDLLKAADETGIIQSRRNEDEEGAVDCDWYDANSLAKVLRRLATKLEKATKEEVPK